MRATKLTPLAALIAAAFIAGCGRDESDAGSAGSTSTATGNTATTPAAGSGSNMGSAGGTAGGTAGTTGGGSTTGSSTTGSSTTGGSTTGSTVAGGTGSAMSGSTAGGTTSGTPADTSTAPTAAAGGGAPLAMADKNFVTTAAVGGMYEVEAGKLAAEKATDPAVKAYGQKLADDHAKANEELKQIAQAHGMALPSELPAAKKQALDKLRKASGAQFDRQYVQQVGRHDHQEDISAFEKAAKDAKDPQLKAFAQKTLPTLREHLAQAKTLPGGGSQASTTGRATTAGASPGMAGDAGTSPGAGTTAMPPGGTTATPPPAR
jgi:putative membrane protein